MSRGELFEVERHKLGDVAVVLDDEDPAHSRGASAWAPMKPTGSPFVIGGVPRT